MNNRLLVALYFALGIVLGGTFAANAPAAPDESDILGALRANPELSIFTQAVLTAGIEEQLDLTQEWTVFAPSDSVLLAETALETPEAVSHYVIQGAYSQDDLLQLAEEHGGMATLTTLGGAEITIEQTEGLLLIGGVAAIAVADIHATNGYIHVIDAAIPMADTAGEGG